jgi:hypothetical protein
MKHILDDSTTQSSLEIFYKKYILVVILLHQIFFEILYEDR